MDGASWQLFLQGLKQHVSPHAAEFIGASASKCDVHVSTSKNVSPALQMEILDLIAHPKSVERRSGCSAVNVEDIV